MNQRGMKVGEEQTSKLLSSGSASESRSEFDFINTLRQRAGSTSTPHSSSVVSGIGDDAAIIRTLAGKDTVITTDLLVEDIDFRRAYSPPYLLGHKALAVSL